MIDWNVRVGDIILLVGLGGTGLIYAFKTGQLAETIKMMQEEIDELKNTGKLIASAITTVAVQKVQIERIEKDIDDMKRGVGFKQDRIRTSVDGEYP